MSSFTQELRPADTWPDLGLFSVALKQCATDVISDIISDFYIPVK